MRQFLVERPKFLSATSNLRVEQNLVHLGRFMHFSQKVVGVTLIKSKPTGEKKRATGPTRGVSNEPKGSMFVDI